MGCKAKPDKSVRSTASQVSDLKLYGSNICLSDAISSSGSAGTRNINSGFWNGM